MDAIGPTENILMPEIKPFNTQAFLSGKNSVLAKLRIDTPRGFQLVSEWINEVARQYNIEPLYLLMVMESEQNLVTRTVLAGPVEFKIEKVIKTLPFTRPNHWDRRSPAGVDDKAIIRKQYAWEGVEKLILRNNGDSNTDGSWYLLVFGSHTMLYALGAGAPDPSIFPPWDVRKYLGLTMQIEQAGRLSRKFMDEFDQKISRSPDELILTLYGGKKFLAADRATHALLRYTPSEKVLTIRPKLYGKFRADAKTMGLIA